MLAFIEIGELTQCRSYLILVRPPVRGICLDAIEDLWRNRKLTAFISLLHIFFTINLCSCSERPFAF